MFPALDLRLSARFLAGKDLYEEVIRDGVMKAKRSVWIATANVKELFVEGDGLKRKRFRSLLETFDELAQKGVELRILHGGIPSRRFRAAYDRHPALTKGGLKLKHCPRVHLKLVIVDGERVYLGSANLTGAGLGAKGEDRRNFELGLVSDSPHLLDQVQAYFDELWRGEPCESCTVRDLCPDPGPYAPTKKTRKRKPTKVLRLDDAE